MLDPEEVIDPDDMVEWLRWKSGGKPESFHAQIADHLEATLLKLSETESTLRGTQETLEQFKYQRNHDKTELESLKSRLDKALVFVGYIAKRYEEGWDDPITERFYNEAKALLGPVS